MSSKPRLPACWRAGARGRLVLSSSSDTRRPRSARRSMAFSWRLQISHFAGHHYNGGAGGWSSASQARDSVYQPPPSRNIARMRAEAPSILLLVERMAAVAVGTQLGDVFLELFFVARAAGVVGAFRGLRRALVEIGKTGPDLGSGEGVGARVLVDVRLPLVAGGREQVRERQQHHRDQVGVRGAMLDIDLAGFDDALELVHVVADRAHQNLAREDHVLGRGGALILAKRRRADAERTCG